MSFLPSRPVSAPFAEKVFKVDTKWIISTVAETGETGFSGDGDLATKAKLSWPTGIAVDPEVAMTGESF